MANLRTEAQRECGTIGYYYTWDEKFGFFSLPVLFFIVPKGHTGWGSKERTKVTQKKGKQEVQKAERDHK